MIATGKKSSEGTESDDEEDSEEYDPVVLDRALKSVFLEEVKSIPAHAKIDTIFVSSDTLENYKSMLTPLSARVTEGMFDPKHHLHLHTIQQCSFW